ncbi:MAG: hypothetical protein ACRD3M_10535, partial [Thermoanaerobaculia bacterium]
MALRKSTRIWLAILAASSLALLLDGAPNRLGAAADFFQIAALVSGTVLFWRAAAAAFRLIIRRLTLRLAFSYFLIGIVPIPLLAALLFLAAYLVAHQHMANRLRREITAVGEAAAGASNSHPV